MAERKNNPPIDNEVPSKTMSLGDEILKLLNEQTENPGQAFVLLQQLSIFIWDQYQIDWKDKEGQKVADTRKQRYLDFVSDLIDTLKANDALTRKRD